MGMMNDCAARRHQGIHRATSTMTSFCTLLLCFEERQFSTLCLFYLSSDIVIIIDVPANIMYFVRLCYSALLVLLHAVGSTLGCTASAPICMRYTEPPW